MHERGRMPIPFCLVLVEIMPAVDDDDHKKIPLKKPQQKIEEKSKQFLQPKKHEISPANNINLEEDSEKKEHMLTDGSGY